MKLTNAPFQTQEADSVVSVLANAFTESEGSEEGKVIAELTHNLIQLTPREDLLGYVAKDDSKRIVGALFFSRYFVAGEETVFILSPVGVCPSAQRAGVGQSLISYGLSELSSHGIDIALVYGSPDYYLRFGFQPLTTDTFPAPFKLSQPHGWLGQAIDGRRIAPRSGKAHCVDAFNNSRYW